MSHKDSPKQMPDSPGGKGKSAEKGFIPRDRTEAFFKVKSQSQRETAGGKEGINKMIKEQKTRGVR